MPGAPVVGDLILDGGELYYGNTKLATTRGGVRFSPGETLRAVEFDGRRAGVAGLDRIVFRDPTLSCTLLDLTAAELALLIPGATSGTVGGVTTITPPDAGVFLTPLSNIRAVFDKGDTGIFEIRFPKAMPERGDLETSDPGEGGFPVTFHALVDNATQNPEDAPYTLHHYTAGTALATL